MLVTPPSRPGELETARRAPRAAGATVALCESVDQLDAVQASGWWPDQVQDVMALTPEVAWALQRRGMPYLKLEDFYEESRLSAMGPGVLRAFVEWMDGVDGFVQGLDERLREADFRPIHLHLHFVKVLIDELVLHAFALTQFLEKYGPARLVYFSPSPTPPDERLFFTETPLGVLMPVVAPTHGVVAEALLPIPVDHAARCAGARRQRPAPGLGSKLGRLLFASLPPSLRSVWRLANDRGLGGCVRHLWAERSGRPHVLALYDRYDVAALLAELRQDGIGATLARYTIDPEGDAETRWPADIDWAAMWTRVRGEASLWRQVDDLGLQAVRSALETRLGAWWRATMPRAWRQYGRARRWLEKRRPLAVISPVIWGHRDSAILAAAKRLGIPRIMYQHGGFVGTCEYWGGWEHIDFLNADLYLMYGDGVRDYFRERSERHALPSTRVEVVGSARLDHVLARRGASDVDVLRDRYRVSGRRLILYITDMIMGYQRGLRAATYPAVRYFELLQRVVGVFADAPGTRLLFKGIPGTDKFLNPMPEVLARDLPDAVVVSHVPLTDLMWCADAIVVDHPSTALLEVLQTPEPILVYCDGRSLQLRPEARALLLERVELVEDEAEFVERLRAFLDRATEPPSNDEFLRSHGTHLGDGRSAERAAEAVARALGYPARGSARR